MTEDENKCHCRCHRTLRQGCDQPECTDFFDPQRQEWPISPAWELDPIAIANGWTPEVDDPEVMARVRRLRALAASVKACNHDVKCEMTFIHIGDKRMETCSCEIRRIWRKLDSMKENETS